MNNGPVERIKELAEPIVSQSGMFIVDVEIKHQEMNVVWVYVDSENDDVNLGTCSKISRELSFLVESEQIFDKAYRLNVSSPGLSRPLTDNRQYTKNLGRTVKVKYKQDGTYEKIEGVLKEVSEGHVKIQHDKGKVTSIQFDDLVETKIVPTI